MGGYEKHIVYFDLIENGEKVRNAGFSKMIAQNGQLRLMVQISGLHKTDTIKGDLIFLQESGEISVDNLQLQEGKCVYSRLFDSETLHRLQIQPEQLYGIYVKAGENRMLRALWKPEPPRQEILNRETENREELLPESWEEQPQVIEPQAVQPQVMEPQAVQPQVIEPQAAEPQVIEPQVIEPQAPEQQAAEPHMRELHMEETSVFEDKWKQLEQTYPVIHPFRDDREYLSVAPKDFIVLTRKYQNLATNSFLLHGFYNYHHLILGKVSKKGDELFYIGVPGVFYEREKAVALMFGFESFECGHEPAQTGELGYYMKRVEI